MRQYAAALISAIVCLIGFAVMGHGAELVPLFITGPTSIIGWTAEGIFLIAVLAIVASLIFFLTRVLHAMGALSLKSLLIFAAVVSAPFAFLMGYSPPLISVWGLLFLGMYFLMLLVTFGLAAICWWFIAKPFAD